MGRCSGFFGGISGYNDDLTLAKLSCNLSFDFRRAERRRREAAAARGEEEVRKLKPEELLLTLSHMGEYYVNFIQAGSGEESEEEEDESDGEEGPRGRMCTQS